MAQAGLKIFELEPGFSLTSIPVPDSFIQKVEHGAASWGSG
jgi:hypothetical protein